MSRIIIIGGIESTYRNAQLLFELGEEICMFFTRGERSPGWEGVDLIDESRFPFASRVPKTIVQGNINEYAKAMAGMHPDYIWSLGWQQLFKSEILDICPVLGIHESLLPEGAGSVPIANAILHDSWGTGIAQDPTALLIGAQQHLWATGNNGNVLHWYWDPNANSIKQDSWGQ